MTRSPIHSSLIAIIPLTALAIPLAQTLKPTPPPTQNPPEITQKASTHRADLAVRSAHPYSSATVTINGASWSFNADEDEQEVYFPFSHSTTVQISATWPEGTPETALLIELIPDELELRSHTFWGEGQLIDETTFAWETL